MALLHRGIRAGVCVAVMLILLGQFPAAQARETTDKVKKVTQSGFLGDYSQLQKGSKTEAQLVYINPQADFNKYTKIIFDPITIYVGGKSKIGKLPPEQLQACVNYLDAAVREKLSPDYAFVTEPGPDVMRLRIALTEIQNAKVVMNTVSTFTPMGIAMSAAKKVTTGASTGVSKAGVEMELLDSVTEQRLAAAVDSRAGKKVTGKLDKLDKDAGIQAAYDYWATRLQQRLAELRQGGGL